LLVFFALVASFPSKEEGSLAVIQTYSDRAKMILFLARHKAGRDGSPTLDINHILEAVVVEDQGAEAMCKLLGVNPATTKQARGNVKAPSSPFFPLEVASGILLKLDQLSPLLEPVPQSLDMPVSDDGAHALSVALSFARELHADKVEPLHLLAAAFKQPSSRAVRIFSEYGVTEERVEARSRDASDGEDSTGLQPVHR
jgi:ATP-dependent Clp protease ATP-binding subunit ClpA